jgi:hypothetical protein
MAEWDSIHWDEITQFELWRCLSMMEVKIVGFVEDTPLCGYQHSEWVLEL